MNRVHFRKSEGLTLCGKRFGAFTLLATGDERLVTCQMCRDVAKRRRKAEAARRLDEKRRGR